MNELRFCFEVYGLAKDDSGDPCPVGMALSFGNVSTATHFDYNKLAESISIPAFLNLAGLSDVIKPEDVKVISPEEYDEKYSFD